MALHLAFLYVENQALAISYCVLQSMINNFIGLVIYFYANSNQGLEKIGKGIATVCDMAIITSKDKFKEIEKGAVGAGFQEKDIILCEKPQDIYNLITLFAKQGDAVLLEGRVPAELIKLLVDEVF